MSERYQAALQGFRPNANPQPQSPPSDTDYMLMLRGLITAVQADLSSVVDPQHLDAQQVDLALKTMEGKTSMNELTPVEYGFAAMFCTEAGKFYADLQANALQTNDTNQFVTFGRQMEIARILQDTLLARGLTVAAAERAQALTPERRF